ncbi:MAG TPA: ATP-binding protein [Lachnospiraceae bacterium]|nr:ATP-binding protein [Lachnospiraceae bacterium]
MECRIHKLLLQPFIENTIIHGFEKSSEIHKLFVGMKEEGEFLCITIADSGKGMEEALVKQLNEGVLLQTEGKYSIGIRNAVSRIKMYYGEVSKVTITSSPGKGTKIEIHIPKEAML